MPDAGVPLDRCRTRRRLAARRRAAGISHRAGLRFTAPIADRRSVAARRGGDPQRPARSPASDRGPRDDAHPRTHRDPRPHQARGRRRVGGMMYALVLIRYRRPMDDVAAATADHRSYLAGLRDAGLLLASGPFDPRTGGALLF